MNHGRATVSGITVAPKHRHITTIAFALIISLVLLPSLSRTSLGFAHGVPLWLALAALINRRKVFVVIALPLILSLPAVLYYQHIYRMAPGVSLWLIILNCSASEIVEYLSGFALPLGTWATIVVLMYAWIIPRLRGPIFRTNGFRWLCFATLIIPLASAISSHHAGKPFASAQAQYFRDSFPWSALTGRFEARHVLAAFEDVEHQVADSSKVEVERIARSNQPRTIVLVIGESARRDRHSIYGYRVPTTPVAEQTDGLVAFSNVVSLYPQTIDAVPVILAKRDRLVPTDRPSPNLVSTFAAAGFRTSWISNQASIGPDDSPVSVYAKYADDRWFARTLSRFGSIPYDEALLPRFRSALASTSGDKFIVVHLFGSHEEFEKRYPANHAVLSDAYDNSIRYTDDLLGQLLADLKRSPGENALIYVSDHGLKLGECDGRSEHFDMKESYEVPLYIWTSPAWRESHARLWEITQANRSVPATTLSVFDTLMDLADLRYPQYQPDQSLLTASPKASRRIVHTFTASVDYDRGVNDKQCHLIQAGQ